MGEDDRTGDDGLPLRLCADLQTEIDAPLERVWWAMSTSAGLRTWYSDSACIQLQIGGKLFWKDPSITPPHQNLISQILSFDPGVSLSLRAVSVPSGIPSRRVAKGAWSTVYLHPVSAERTRLRVRCLVPERGRSLQAIADSMREGAAQSLQRLRQALAPSQAPVDGDHDLKDEATLEG